MKLKSIFALIILFSLGQNLAFSQDIKDPKAKAVLDKLSAKNKSFKITLLF